MTAAAGSAAAAAAGPCHCRRLPPHRLGQPTANPLTQRCRRAQDATALHDLQRWAEAERCGEAQRLLAKAHLQVALNRILRSDSSRAATAACWAC